METDEIREELDELRNKVDEALQLVQPMQEGQELDTVRLRDVLDEIATMSDALADGVGDMEVEETDEK